jgi:Holliday junction DNA helicase RuvB
MTSDSEHTNEKDIKIQRYVSPQEESVDTNNYFLFPKLRPERFIDYPGQEKVKGNLEVYVKAALKRGQPLDHVLLHGPPGLGKTTLANILANELGIPIHNASGPSIEKPGDLAGIITSLEPGSLLFIDEIHRLSVQVEEILYSVMEDFCLDLVLGQGPTARSRRIEISPFTLVGATTRVSSLSRPLLSRFGIQERLEFYSEQALIQIVSRSANILQIDMDIGGAGELVKRSRGTPRIANRLLKRVWDFAEVEGSSIVDHELVKIALGRLEIDECGLDKTDREILRIVEERYDGGPVGIDALAVSVGEERATIEEVYEPFLVYRGFLIRSPRGRMLSERGRNHLKNTEYAPSMI